MKQKIPARKSIVGPLPETKGILAGQKTKGGAVQYDLLHNFEYVKDAKGFLEEIKQERLIIK